MNNDRFARGCGMAKHGSGIQQVLMTEESQDALSLLILASEFEKTQKLLWLHRQNVFCPDIIDDHHHSIYKSAG